MRTSVSIIKVDTFDMATRVMKPLVRKHIKVFQEDCLILDLYPGRGIECKYALNKSDNFYLLRYISKDEMSKLVIKRIKNIAPDLVSEFPLNWKIDLEIVWDTSYWWPFKVRVWAESKSSIPSGE